jgi:hypothetical protein
MKKQATMKKNRVNDTSSKSKVLTNITNKMINPSGPAFNNKIPSFLPTTNKQKSEAYKSESAQKSKRLYEVCGEIVLFI